MKKSCANCDYKHIEGLQEPCGTCGEGFTNHKCDKEVEEGRGEDGNNN